MSPTAAFPEAARAEVPSVKVLKNASTSDPLVAAHRAKKEAHGDEGHIDWNGNYRFAAHREAETSRAMTSRYMKDMMDAAVSDVVIIGAGSAGLTCAYKLGKARPDLRITILEASVAPGGGCWLGGQLMSAMVVRKPANDILDELEVPYEDEGRYVVVKHAALFTSTVLSKVLRMPNVKLFNAVCAEDLMIKTDSRGVKRVNGVVTNWTLVSLNHGLQSCMDPQTITAPVVVSCCGHDGPFGAFSVKRLASAGHIEIGSMGCLDIIQAEDDVANLSDFVFPGLIVGGMECAEAKSLPRMGPNFSSMLASGARVARKTAEMFDRLVLDEGEVVYERDETDKAQK